MFIGLPGQQGIRQYKGWTQWTRQWRGPGPKPALIESVSFGKSLPVWAEPTAGESWFSPFHARQPDAGACQLPLASRPGNTWPPSWQSVKSAIDGWSGPDRQCSSCGRSRRLPLVSQGSEEPAAQLTRITYPKCAVDSVAPEAQPACLQQNAWKRAMVSLLIRLRKSSSSGTLGAPAIVIFGSLKMSYIANFLKFSWHIIAYKRVFI